MADRSKKQLIYKDYSAVNTNGSSLNVDLTENSSLLGGEIWYNWQTATSVLMRTKGITTSRHHSRFFSGLMNKMSTYFWQCPWRAPSKEWKEWDETETIFWLLPIGNTVTAESVSVFWCATNTFWTLTLLTVLPLQTLNHTWWEVVSRRQQKSGVTKHFFIPKKLGRFRVSKFLAWCLISLEQTQLWSPSF